MGANSRRRREARQRRQRRSRQRSRPSAQGRGLDPATLLAATLRSLHQELVEAGWTTADLRELVRRCLGPTHLWLLDRLDGGERPLELPSAEAQAVAHRLAALLSRTPRLRASDLIGEAAPDGGGSDHPKLAQVRALLAKAESTEYAAEAEALSAKAQELITKYALDGLVAATDEPDSDRRPVVRRLWLDPPYLDAKAALVHQVAEANRGRSASATEFQYCVLVGAPLDLDVIELLVTSLLVQANTAMLWHGRRVGSDGGSRTRSFRRAFLLAYAVRIGERLKEADRAAVADAGGDLLPVLRDQQERVDAAFQATIPTTSVKRSFSNPEGWVAGTAAADLAQLEVGAALRERPS